MNVTLEQFEQLTAVPKKIKSIRCPHCQERYLELDNFIRVWKCHKCVYSYPYSWFDIFKQFENLVTREE